MSTGARYAVYFLPPEHHPLMQAGRAWLKPDRPHTADPRPYGFHATLKAPMRLAAGRPGEAFLAAAAALAQHHAAFEMPRLQVAPLGRFLALQPAGGLDAGHPLCRLAADAVLALDAWRAPPMPAEIARRRPEALSERQRALLDRHGYPYVLDEWRFHMTLSDAVAPDTLEVLSREARVHFQSALSQPLRCEDLAVCVQASPDEAFVLWQRLPLA
jgi:hypothetical protein